MKRSKMQGWMVFPALLSIVIQLAVANDCQLPPGCPPKTQVYLTAYGYLNPMKNCTKDDIVAGLTKFQEMNIGFQGLQVTGQCDTITVQVMNAPRCGCEDIDKFEKQKMMPQSLIGPQMFRVGPMKWPKKLLTWKVLKYPIRNNHLTNAQVDDAMRRGLQIWADVTSLKFQQSTSGTPDITIKFEVGRHTASPPYYDFDGRGNVLAHAFFPTSGVVHFDDDEKYVLGSNEGTELYIVAAHEFGHTLGISHSNIQEALMAPYYRYSVKLELHPDDIAAAQSMYGPPDTAPTKAATTARPVTTLAPPTPPPNVPDYCNLKVQASFKVANSGITYIFTRERVGTRRMKTYVYKVTENGLDVNSKTPIEKMFLSHSRWVRGYPWRVDAAEYVPDRRCILLLTNTRSYKYTVQDATNPPFTLDQDYPRWMDVHEFPERPRAAVSMPYPQSTRHYMLIFGRTMVWDWNFFNDRVGAWAYPIDAYGRNMPLKVDSGFLQDRENAAFIKGDKYYLFSLRYRRILDENSVKDVKKFFFKGQCAA